MTPDDPVQRLCGLRGRKPKKAPGDRFPLRWAHEYLKADVGRASYPVDVTEGIVTWPMAGNDQWGDCVEAAEIHLEMATAVAVSAPLPSPTEAVLRYKEFTGATLPPGTGTTIADYLLDLYKAGLIKAFAPVDPSTLARADAFMAAGYGLLVGVTLTPNAETLFNEGRPWGSVTPITPTPRLGHCILRNAATQSTPDAIAKNVTWGAEQISTRAWDKACTDELWLIVTTEEQAAAFTKTLLADVAALGGTGGPTTPVPPPVPAPPAPTTPGPTPPTPVPSPTPTTPGTTTTGAQTTGPTTTAPPSPPTTNPIERLERDLADAEDALRQIEADEANPTDGG